MWLLTWHRTLLYWIGIITFILLIIFQQSTWALVMLMGFIIYVYDRNSNMFKEELEWISEAVILKEERHDYTERMHFWLFVRDALANSEPLIKNGMTTREIYKILSKADEEKNKSNHAMRLQLYFGDDKKDDNITLLAFGLGVPTPRLLLKVRKGKLVGWRQVK